MEITPTQLRIPSPNERHITEMRFEGPVIVINLLVKDSEGALHFDLKRQEELMEALKTAARKLHGNLSTGLVMKELYDKGIGLRGQVSEAMLLATGDCLIEAGLMSQDERETFAAGVVRQRIVYSAKKGIEGMEKGPSAGKIQALSSALLHNRDLTTLGDMEYAESWQRIHGTLQELISQDGDFTRISVDGLVTLELASRANLEAVTDQTAWAIVDIAKKSEFAIRDALKAKAGAADARTRALKRLGARASDAEKPGFWKKLLT